MREKTGASFIVTCGAGGTLGYRDWQEVQAGLDTQLFGNDPQLFESMRTSEIRLWYRVEWNAATTGIEMNYLREHEEHSFRVSTMTFVGGGAGGYGNNSGNNYAGQYMGPNMGGTIQMIQRLRDEPADLVLPGGGRKPGW